MTAAAPAAYLNYVMQPIAYAPADHCVRGKKMTIPWILWINFKEMPVILKLLTFHAALCVIALFVVFPVGGYRMYGKDISYMEFWRSGAVLMTVLIGILLPASAYLMLKRSSIARPFYLGSMCLILLSTLVLEITQGQFESVVPGALPLGSLTAYLYLRKPVRR
jgi:hypothetical protein